MQVVLLRTIAAASLLLLTASASHAVVLDWTAVTWTAGTTASGSNSYNVDGVAGNDITVAYTNSGATFSSVPSIAAVNGTTDLRFALSSMNSTANSVTVTITFTGTAYAGGVFADFTLNDVDANLASGGFQDKVSISALNAGNPVALTVTNSGGTSVNTVSGSGTTAPSALGNTATSTNPEGDVTINSGGNGVTSITFVWNNPSTFFGTQIIGLNNITFTAVPEVASSSAALSLCGGLLAFRRRRSQRAAA